MGRDRLIAEMTTKVNSRRHRQGRTRSGSRYIAERVERLEEAARIAAEITRTRTRMTLAEPRVAGSHTQNEDGLT